MSIPSLRAELVPSSMVTSRVSASSSLPMAIPALQTASSAASPSPPSLESPTRHVSSSPALSQQETSPVISRVPRLLRRVSSGVFSRSPTSSPRLSTFSPRSSDSVAATFSFPDLKKLSSYHHLKEADRTALLKNFHEFLLQIESWPNLIDDLKYFAAYLHEMERNLILQTPLERFCRSLAMGRILSMHNSLLEEDKPEDLKEFITHFKWENGLLMLLNQRVQHVEGSPRWEKENEEISQEILAQGRDLLEMVTDRVTKIASLLEPQKLGELLSGQLHPERSKYKEIGSLLHRQFPSIDIH